MIPPKLKKYFWDIDVDELDFKKEPEYVIIRLLEYGDVWAIHWLLKNFDKKLIKKTILKHRGLSPRSINLYFILAVEKKITLQKVMDLYDRKFRVLRQNKTHLLKSLVYFEDAEKDRMPKMIKDVDWAGVKKKFEKEIKNIGQKIF